MTHPTTKAVDPLRELLDGNAHGKASHIAVESIESALPAHDAAIEARARLEEAEWWARKASHIGPAPGVKLDQNCEMCVRITTMRADLERQIEQASAQHK